MRVSERSVVVTVLSAFALGLMAVYSPWLVLVLAAVFAAPFVYLRLSWKRDLARRRRERFWT